MAPLLVQIRMDPGVSALWPLPKTEIDKDPADMDVAPASSPPSTDCPPRKPNLDIQPGIPPTRSAMVASSESPSATQPASRRATHSDERSFRRHPSSAPRGGFRSDKHRAPIWRTIDKRGTALKRPSPDDPLFVERQSCRPRTTPTKPSQPFTRLDAEAREFEQGYARARPAPPTPARASPSPEALAPQDPAAGWARHLKYAERSFVQRIKCFALTCLWPAQGRIRSLWL